MKRKRGSRSTQSSVKKPRLEGGKTPEHPTVPLLDHYYHQVHTLRRYLLSQLPKTSKKRRRRLVHFGTEPNQDRDVATLLDAVLVGTTKHVPTAELDTTLDNDISVFTQQLSDSDITLSSSTGRLKQAEIVDFAIWSLFRRRWDTNKIPSVLCHGFQRTVGASSNGVPRPAPGIPGVYISTDNPYVNELKLHPWTGLPDLLGRSADRIIGEMLMDCGIFRPVAGSSNVSQICGTPLSDLKSGSAAAARAEVSAPGEARLGLKDKKAQKLSDIRFLRHRMLYAKPSLKAAGGVRFGLNRAHVLARYCNLEDLAETMHVMKYVFPRQFRLHNVFTSATDPKDTAQHFKDYTLREYEISRCRQRRQFRPGQPALPADKIPKRLRGEAVELVQRLRKRHSRCSYTAMLQYYCPLPQTSSASSSDMASTPSQISAFCRAVIRNVFPSEFFGSTGVHFHNFAIIMKSLDRFIKMRRYESTSLHDVMQSLQVGEIPWLAPPKSPEGANLSATDTAKRKELMAELLYYLFDSFLVPLIRSHFHVTESNSHRNQLLYFRHDAWKEMSEPAIAALKTNMFEECNASQVKQSLAQRALGVSQVRLLPKDHGTRPIINLRRRTQRQQYGKLVLGRSINSVLTPAFSILNFEKTTRPGLLGSALFSVDDMFARLQSFRVKLAEQGCSSSPLYFAKVDVQACFDTIPQKRLMELAKTLLSADEYQIRRYARGKLLGGHNPETPGFGAKPSWRFLTKAVASEAEFDFASEVQKDSGEGRTRTAYIDGVVSRKEQRRAVINLLQEHVQSNLVRLGSRFYRQKTGIPQGSIVSSLLCSYFYAELEHRVLGFIDNGRTLLLRLIDDFLLITPDLPIATQFMHTMHAGIPEFGVTVKPSKSRTNFPLTVNSIPISDFPATTDFPYCGNAINTATLDISKDITRRRAVDFQHSVTVERSKLPGQNFYRKTLNAVKLQMHAMLLSTRYNALDTVFLNLHHAFTEVALKSYHYVKSLPGGKQPSGRLIIKSLDDSIALAVALMKRRKPSSKTTLPYACAVTPAQTRWLACTAFATVFKRRQTRFRALLVWVHGQLRGSGERDVGGRAVAAKLKDVVRRYEEGGR